MATGKDTKTGVALPSKALLGTAKEIDDALVEFLPKYAASAGRISDVLANADAELETAERNAGEAARKAVAEKSKGKIKPGAAVNTAPGGAKRNLSAGMLDEEDGGEAEEGDDAPSSTTLNAVPPSIAGAPAGTGAPGVHGALHESLF